MIQFSIILWIQFNESGFNPGLDPQSCFSLGVQFNTIIKKPLHRFFLLLILTYKIRRTNVFWSFFWPIDNDDS
jgi:hypothetical protein